MSWNGLGSYLLPPAYSPEVNGSIIDATRYNGLTGDVATGISACLAKNGENTPTANLPMGGFKHTGVAAGTAAGQYLVYGQALNGSQLNINGAGGGILFTMANSTTSQNFGTFRRFDNVDTAYMGSADAVYPALGTVTSSDFGIRAPLGQIALSTGAATGVDFLIGSTYITVTKPIGFGATGTVGNQLTVTGNSSFVGNVGIGGTSSGAVLETFKASAAVTPVSDNTFPAMTSGALLKNLSATDGAYVALSLVAANAAGTSQGFSLLSQSTAAGYSPSLLFLARTASGANTERMRIDPSGNAVVGSATSYGGRVTVIPATDPTTYTAAKQICVGESSANSGYRLQLGYANTAGGLWRGSIQAIAGGVPSDLVLNGDGGNVGIGAAPSSQRLTVSANSQTTAIPVSINDERAADAVNSASAYFYRAGALVGSISTTNAATFYNTTSDRRLKTNIVDASEAGDVIDSLRVRAFDWKTSDEHVTHGFIAQELAVVAPQAVHVGGDDPTINPWAVDPSKLVPLLVKAVQELNTRVLQLEGV